MLNLNLSYPNLSYPSMISSKVVSSNKPISLANSTQNFVSLQLP